jgi:hypothetical protein
VNYFTHNDIDIVHASFGYPRPSGVGPTNCE